jgi:hypothetical protein
MKLTLRELFLLVVIAAMGCGWWLDREGLVATNKALIEFYETPIEFDAPITPSEPFNVVENPNAKSESLIMESEPHQRLIEGKPIQ